VRAFFGKPANFRRWRSFDGDGVTKQVLDLQSAIEDRKLTVPVVQRREQWFPNPDGSPLRVGKAFPEVVSKRQNQPLADNYLATTGNAKQLLAEASYPGGYDLLWLV